MLETISFGRNRNKYWGVCIAKALPQLVEEIAGALFVCDNNNYSGGGKKV